MHGANGSQQQSVTSTQCMYYSCRIAWMRVRNSINRRDVHAGRASRPASDLITPLQPHPASLPCDHGNMQLYTRAPTDTPPNTTSALHPSGLGGHQLFLNIMRTIPSTRPVGCVACTFSASDHICPPASVHLVRSHSPIINEHFLMETRLLASAELTMV